MPFSLQTGLGIIDRARLLRSVQEGEKRATSNKWAEHLTFKSKSVSWPIYPSDTLFCRRFKPSRTSFQPRGTLVEVHLEQ